MTPDPPSQALYVSYHGEKESSGEAVPAGNNLDVINSNPVGPVATNVLGEVTPPAALAELRAVTFGPDGLLWVVSGAGATSQILRFTATMNDNGVHDFVDVVDGGSHLASISHPFDIAFDPSGATWFVSNQNTNVVVGPLAVTAAKTRPETPAFAQYLNAHYPAGGFCPGTFVASASKALVTCQSQLVPHPQGLRCLFDGDQKNSVRGLAHDGRLLYVADEVANEVKGYDASGQLVWQFTGDANSGSVEDPVHLLLARSGLFVGSSGNGNIIFTQPSGGQDSVVVAEGVKKLSGLAIDAAGTLYYASRHHQQVYALNLPPGPVTAKASEKGQAYGPHLEQAPEFITCAPTPL
jgi:DNA-binding beta-propeller fold protein YncE